MTRRNHKIAKTFVTPPSHEYVARDAADERDQVNRLAELVAKGHAEIPSDLSAEQASVLVDRVRRIRRQMLMRSITQTVALYLRDRSETKKGNR